MFDPHTVAVTGMGCITAAGETLPLTLSAIDRGVQNAVPTPFAGVAPASPVFQCVHPLPSCDGDFLRTVHLAFGAAREALAQAGLEEGRFADAPRVGVCLGTSVGASLMIVTYYRARRYGEEPSFDSPRRYCRSNPALALARLLGAEGPALTVANACSSGADAIGIGMSWLRQDICDIVIAGGADELSEVSYTGFSRLMITSPEICRPFDAARSGLNLGEGAGIMVLERSGNARRRNAPIVGRVLGYGTATDSHHLTAPHPEGAGLSKAYAQAFGEAGIGVGDLAFVNAHGTATKTNDMVEGGFFHNKFPRVPFVATKGATGHTLGAAGAIEAVIATAHLTRGSLPASPGFSSPDAAIGTGPVSSPRDVSGSVAASQSLAFGGNNSVLILGTGGEA